MEFTIEFDREEDGRWIAEIEAIPGAIAYGDTPHQAAFRAKAIALREISARMEDEQDHSITDFNTIQFRTDDEQMARV